MDQAPRFDEMAEEVARIREVVARHPFPDFVKGFDVRLGEFEGDPALWVVFKTESGWPHDKSAREQRVAALLSLHHTVWPDLLENSEHRFPYLGFEDADPATH